MHSNHRIALPHPARSSSRERDTKDLGYAVCINQHDVPERNDQVLLMDLVYSGAQKVVTYIGEGTDERYLGILLAQQLCDHVAKSYSKQDPERYPELGLPHGEDPCWGYL